MSGVADTSIRGICDPAAQLARIARLQGGHLTSAQLHEYGLTRSSIESRTKAGRLFRVHDGVYALGHLPTNPADRAHGALLAAGERSALSGGSAAALWGLYERWPDQVEVISPLRRRIPGVKASRCSTLLGRDVRVEAGSRVTSPARTLLDIAPRTPTKTLHRFHNELRMRRLISNDALLDVAARNRQHPGSKQLRLLAGASGGEAKRSSFEVDWQAFAQQHNLPAYEMNVHVAGRRVDVLFTPARLIVELDGWGTHGTRQAFERDRDQDAAILAATGIPTMRITYHGLHRRPTHQAKRVNAVLTRR